MEYQVPPSSPLRSGISSRSTSHGKIGSLWRTADRFSPVAAQFASVVTAATAGLVFLTPQVSPSVQQGPFKKIRQGFRF